MSTRGERLRTFREYLGFSQKAFSEELNTAQRNISKYETGMTSIPDDLEDQLAEKGLNLHWLATGEGEMLHSATFEGEPKNATVANLPEPEPSSLAQAPAEEFRDSSGSVSTELVPKASGAPAPIHPGIVMLGNPDSPGAPIPWGFPRNVTVYKYRRGRAEPVEIHSPDPEGVVFIPIYSQTASAGPGQEPTQLAETEGMMPCLYDLFGLHRPEHCGIVRVVGDSMTDITLSNGDWCIFDSSDRKGDGIFVISMFGEVRVKRLQYRLADRKIVISSENAKRYPEPEIVGVETIEGGQLTIYGRVFSWLHKHPY